ncbi:MAG: hypothetical protein J5911_03610 [Clostridia bacterium]|nr:hypothetical protein [Clostridia bacterium]
MKFYKTVWFKCIACLLVIALISGASITVLANLWEVSATERTARAIKKIYGEEKEYSVILDADGEDEIIEYDGVGTVNKVYDVSGDLLFRTTGYKGYKNGTITLWIKAAKNGETYAIDKIILQSAEKQTLMSKLSGDFYDGFKLTDVTAAYNDKSFFSASDKTATNYNPVSGATYSATAATNAVNCVIRYLGGER